MNLGYPFRERQVIIPRKRKGLPGSREIKGYITEDDEEEHDYGEPIDAACWNSFAEDINERKAGRIVDCVVDGGDGKEVDDQYDESRDTVANVCPDHSAWHGDGSLFGFLGHMRRRVRAEAAKNGRDLSNH